MIVKTPKFHEKTSVKQEAGKTPVWNETLTMELDRVAGFIDFICMEEDSTSDDLVGSVTLDLISLVKKIPL